MNGIKLCGTGAAAPAKVVTNDDMAAMVETSDEWISTRTGIKERRYCTDETLLSLCTDAARQAMDRAGISPADLGVCLVATISPDFITPALSCLLQRELVGELFDAADQASVLFAQRFDLVLQHQLRVLSRLHLFAQIKNSLAGFIIAEQGVRRQRGREHYRRNHQRGQPIFFHQHERIRR